MADSIIKSVNVPKSAWTSWGTELVAQGFTQGMLQLGDHYPIMVWFPGDTTVDVRWQSDDGDTYRETADNSVSFSLANPSGSYCTIVRGSDKQITVTITSNSSMMLTYC